MQNELINFLVSGLAVWRVSSLLVNEEGPFNLFHHIRSFFGLSDDEMPSHFFAKLLSCVWCVSIYIAVPFYFGLVPEFIIYILALSSLAILVETNA